MGVHLPDTVACLAYTYTKAAGNDGPRWSVLQHTSGCTGHYGERQVWHDVFGRKRQQRVQIPGGDVVGAGVHLRRREPVDGRVDARGSMDLT